MLKNKSLLIVEDEVFIAGLLETLLGDLGCRSIGTKNSVSGAFEALGKSSPDLVILDINLNGKSGIPIAEHLRDRGIHFIISSGYSREYIGASWAKYPSLPKPFIFEDLSKKLLEVFSGACQN